MRQNKLLPLLFWGLVMAIIIQSCQSEQQLNYARYYVNGKGLFEKHCQNCHNSDGKGLGELIPPLTDSSFLKKNRKRLACIIKYGLKEKIEVSGRNYEEVMPANDQLADIDIAEIITYITNSFGNSQGLYDVQKAEKDLSACNRK